MRTLGYLLLLNIPVFIVAFIFAILIGVSALIKVFS